MCSRLPCSAADEHDVPLLRQLVFLRGHRSITRPVEQFLEQVLHQAGRRRKTQHRLTTHRSPRETSTSELAWRPDEYRIWRLNTVHGITAEKEDQVISNISLCTRQNTDVRARSKKGLHLPNISRFGLTTFGAQQGTLSVSATPREILEKRRGVPGGRESGNSSGSMAWSRRRRRPWRQLPPGIAGPTWGSGPRWSGVVSRVAPTEHSSMYSLSRMREAFWGEVIHTQRAKRACILQAMLPSTNNAVRSSSSVKGKHVRTFSSSAILLISARPALPSFLSSFLAKLRVLSRAFCSASLKGGAWTGRMPS